MNGTSAVSLQSRGTLAEIAKHFVVDYHDYRKVWFIYFIYYARRQHNAIQHTTKSTMIREKRDKSTQNGDKSTGLQRAGRQYDIWAVEGDSN